ncbi:EH domain-containing protein 3 isoform X1 [Monomorium pharaonis]|uniref:EH domain-containing protein 3 isoform X1 n=2 Tax=Monomorium pharaonis TaxID=307658 RepID=UPI00102E1037|nr:EH domain-containing protein 3 isoform X1 [Monomorium pharaonis]
MPYSDCCRQPVTAVIEPCRAVTSVPSVASIFERSALVYQHVPPLIGRGSASRPLRFSQAARAQLTRLPPVPPPFASSPAAIVTANPNGHHHHHHRRRHPPPPPRSLRKSALLTIFRDRFSCIRHVTAADHLRRRLAERSATVSPHSALVLASVALCHARLFIFDRRIRRQRLVIVNMFSWLSREENSKQDLFENVTDGLKRIYKSKLLPLEQYYQFHDFHSPQLDDPDFDAKPMILLVGQYSTGKTTFIKYLLEREFPGIRIGPEPTTDRFIAVMYDEKEGVIPGNALVVDPIKQFRPLSKFGNAFLNRFQCSTVASPVLKGISIVDTPGILSGEKQRVDRGYDFTGVLEWFAERVDRIILLFDAHKLDISDEFRRSIEALRGHDDKIRIVLNKADMIDHQQLMRVYGALMWSLGKVLQTPEVARVYIGSFWDQPLRYDVNRRLFEDEEQDLFKDMQSLPKNAALRKLNDLIKRARLAKVHAYIISGLRKDMPSMFGKENKKKELIKNLGQIYDQIQREQQISPGDFPDLKKMQECLAHHDFNKFNPLKLKLLEVVDKMLAEDIAKLMAMIPHEEVTTVSEPLIKGGAFEGVEDQISPFGYKRGEGIDAGAGEPEWIVNKERYKYDSIFESLGPQDGKITGAAAKSEMVKSKLPNSVLGKIWKLSDINKDGFLDSDEFALAMHLINIKLEGYDLPAELPEHLIPPSKRDT